VANLDRDIHKFELLVSRNKMEEKRRKMEDTRTITMISWENDLQIRLKMNMKHGELKSDIEKLI